MQKLNKIFVSIFVLSCLRVFFLSKQPPFVDEATYYLMADRIHRNFVLGNLLIPFKIGISPFFIYLYSFSLLVVKNPIISGRIVSFVLYIFSVVMFSKYLKLIQVKNYHIGLFFFALNPFIFLYSQMALLEMSLVFSSLCFLYSTEKNIRQFTVLNIFILSCLFVLVVFSKINGAFLIIYPALRFFQERKIRFFLFFLFITLAFSIFFLPLIKQLLMTVSYHTTPSTFSNILENSKNNIHLIFLWVKDYFYLIFIAIIFLSLLQNLRSKIISALTVALFCYVIVIVLTAYNFFPRYLILFSVYFSVLLANLNISKVFLKIVIFLTIMIYGVNDFFLVFNQKNAHIALEDRYQYVYDWTSGKNIIRILSATKENSAICVSPGDFDYFKIANISYFKRKKIQILKNCKTYVFTAKSS